MPAVRTVDAATEPITLAEAKAHLRVDVATDDALITAMIVAARNVCGQELQRALITQTWRLSEAAFWSPSIDLPWPVLQTVTSVKYYDTNNVQRTLVLDTDYRVDNVSQPGRIVAIGAWPATFDRPYAVEVIYVAGYTNAAAVPQAIKQWLLMQVATMYDNRATHDTTRDAAATKLPWVDCLLDPFRVWPL